MFAATFIYMYIWVYTGEVNAKRLRESYLRATLPQDIAYFDNFGAGEIATRIQTDTRESASDRPMQHLLTRVIRLGPAGHFGEGCTRG